MTGDAVRSHQEAGGIAVPFLMRFARECADHGKNGGDKKPPPRTLVTEVRRETTDDR